MIDLIATLDRWQEKMGYSDDVKQEALEHFWGNLRGDSFDYPHVKRFLETHQKAEEKREAMYVPLQDGLYDPWEEIDNTIDTKALIAKILPELSPREEIVIRLQYWQGMTLEEIGSFMKINRERVRQISLKALSKIRWRAKNELNPVYHKRLHYWEVEDVKRAYFHVRKIRSKEWCIQYIHKLFPRIDVRDIEIIIENK